jgi:hypothetical protein
MWYGILVLHGRQDSKGLAHDEMTTQCIVRNGKQVEGKLV